jgi:hypothetical protein
MKNNVFYVEIEPCNEDLIRNNGRYFDKYRNNLKYFVNIDVGLEVKDLRICF